MINYNQFNQTSNHSFNVYQAIKYCQEHKIDCLSFDKNTYDFYADMASEDVLHVSNHDIYGIQRIAFLLKDMDNFTIDGGGSTFIFHDSIIPFAGFPIDVKNVDVIGCKKFNHVKNIKIRKK